MPNNKSFLQDEFPCLVILAIAWPKLSQNISFFPLEVQSMDALTIAIGLFLCIVIPILIFGGIILVRIWHGKPANTTNENPITEASILWVIPGILGWIFIKKDEQVGIIGNTIYHKTTFFVMTSPPGSTNMKTVSLKQNTGKVIVNNAVTQDGAKIAVVVNYLFQIKSKAVPYLIKKYDNPLLVLHDTLQSAISVYISTEQFNTLMGDKDMVREKLEKRLQDDDVIKNFNVIIQDIKLDGKHVDVKDDISILADKQKLVDAELENERQRAQIEIAKITEIEKISLAKELIKAMTMTGEMTPDQTKILQDLLRNNGVTNFPQSIVSPDKPIAYLPDNEWKKVISKPFKVKDVAGGYYHLEIYGYDVILDANDFPDSTVIKIKDSNKVIHVETVSWRSRGRIIGYIKEIVEKKLNE